MINNILQKLKEDLTEAKNYRAPILERIKYSIDRYNGELYGNEEKGKSKYVSKDIFRQIEKQQAIIKDPFVNNNKIVKLISTNIQEKLFIMQSELLINFQFIRNFNRYKFMTDLIKTVQIEGTAFIRVGWDYKTEEVEEEVPLIHTNSLGQKINLGTHKLKKDRILINRPTAIICKNEDIYVDPSASNWEDVQFIIHKTETSLSELLQAGIYDNLDKVKQAIESTEIDSNIDIDEFNFSREKDTDTSTFNFKDTARKKLTMYEYWGNYDLDGDGIAEPIVCSWIEDTIIRLENNPYPDKEIPFIPVQYASKPFSIYGLSVADILDDQQKIKTGIMRGIIDDLAQSNSNQKGVRKGNLDPINKKRFLEGKTFEYNFTKDDFYQGNYTPINSSVFNTLGLVDKEIEELTAFSQDSATGSQAFGNSLASRSNKLMNGAIRELDLVRNIAENAIKPLLKKWLIYCYEFMQPEEIQQITTIPYQKSANGNYLGSIVDFKVTISTNQVNEAKSQDLAFLLQTLGNNLPFDLTKMVMVEMARLKNMDELATKLEQFEPKPDPIKQQYQQLELQKLQAEIAFKQAGAKENEADYELKQAKAKEASNKADLLDLDFTHKYNGIDYSRELEKESLKNLSEINKIKEQTKAKYMGDLLKADTDLKKQYMSMAIKVGKELNNKG